MEVVVIVMVTTADMCSAFRYCRVASNWVWKNMAGIR